MPRPADVPEQLWLSDSSLRSGGKQFGHAKMPWTPALAARARAMHEAGDPWEDVAQMLEAETGVRLQGKSVESYLRRNGGES